MHALYSEEAEKQFSIRSDIQAGAEDYGLNNLDFFNSRPLQDCSRSFPSEINAGKRIIVRCRTSRS
jgi:hypothetical protein